MIALVMVITEEKFVRVYFLIFLFVNTGSYFLKKNLMLLKLIFFSSNNVVNSKICNIISSIFEFYTFMVASVLTKIAKNCEYSLLDFSSQIYFARKYFVILFVSRPPAVNIFDKNVELNINHVFFL